MQLPDGETIREYVGAPEGAEVIVVLPLGQPLGDGRAACSRLPATEARNYAGSWHEWAASPELPIE